MCRPIEHPSIMPGWGCCSCRVYNGLQNRTCKNCGRTPCATVDFVRLREQAVALVGAEIVDQHVPKEGP